MMGKFTQDVLDGLDLSDLDTAEYDTQTTDQGEKEGN